LWRAEDEVFEVRRRATQVAAAAENARPFELGLGSLGRIGMLGDDALPRHDRMRSVAARSLDARRGQ